MKRKLLIIILVLSLISTVAAQNVVLDDFEDGDIDEWTASQKASYAVTVVSENPYEGNYEMRMGANEWAYRDSTVDLRGKVSNIWFRDAEEIAVGYFCSDPSDYNTCNTQLSYFSSSNYFQVEENNNNQYGEAISGTPTTWNRFEFNLTNYPEVTGSMYNSNGELLDSATITVSDETGNQNINIDKGSEGEIDYWTYESQVSSPVIEDINTEPTQLIDGESFNATAKVTDADSSQNDLTVTTTINKNGQQIITNETVSYTGSNDLYRYEGVDTATNGDTYEITFKAWDEGGRTATDTQTFNVDNIPPTISNFNIDPSSPKYPQLVDVSVDADDLDNSNVNVYLDVIYNDGSGNTTQIDGELISQNVDVPASINVQDAFEVTQNDSDYFVKTIVGDGTDNTTSDTINFYSTPTVIDLRDQKIGIEGENSMNAWANIKNAQSGDQLNATISKIGDISSTTSPLYENNSLPSPYTHSWDTSNFDIQAGYKSNYSLTVNAYDESDSTQYSQTTYQYFENEIETTFTIDESFNETTLTTDQLYNSSATYTNNVEDSPYEFADINISIKHINKTEGEYSDYTTVISSNEQQRESLGYNGSLSWNYEFSENNPVFEFFGIQGDGIDPAALDTENGLKLKQSIEYLNQSNQTEKTESYITYHQVTTGCNFRYLNTCGDTITDWIVNGVSNAVGGVLDAIFNSIEILIDYIVELLNAIIDAIFGAILIIINGLTYILSMIIGVVDFLFTAFMNWNLGLMLTNIETNETTSLDANQSNATISTALQEGYALTNNETFFEYTNRTNKRFADASDKLDANPVFTYEYRSTTFRQGEIDAWIDEQYSDNFVTDENLDLYQCTFGDNAFTWNAEQQYIECSAGNARINMSDIWVTNATGTQYINTTGYTFSQEDAEFNDFNYNLVVESNNFSSSIGYTSPTDSPLLPRMEFEVINETHMWVNKSIHYEGTGNNPYETKNDIVQHTVGENPISFEYEVSANSVAEDETIRFDSVSTDLVLEQQYTTGTKGTNNQVSVNWYSNPFDYPNGYPVGTIAVLSLASGLIGFILSLLPSVFGNSLSGFLDNVSGIVNGATKLLGQVMGGFTWLYTTGFEAFKLLLLAFAGFKGLKYLDWAAAALDKDNPTTWTTAGHKITDDLTDQIMEIHDIAFQSIGFIISVISLFVDIMRAIRDYIKVW